MFPVETVRAMGYWVCLWLPFLRSAKRAADHFPHLHAMRRRAESRDASMAITLEAGVSLGASPFFYSGTGRPGTGVPRSDDRKRCSGVRLTQAEAGADDGATKTQSDARQPLQ